MDGEAIIFFCFWGFDYPIIGCSNYSMLWKNKKSKGKKERRKNEKREEVNKGKGGALIERQAGRGGGAVEMKLLKKAAGVIKDRNSIWVASLCRKSSYRNPDLEAIVIKATSHDESYVDYKNFHRVYKWVRASPLYVKPLLWAISSRMEKTRSWVVALKGLMLMHGVFCCQIPAVQSIGRLPFDLSNFIDGHSKSAKTWVYDAMVRAYFTYLDQRSGAFEVTNIKKQRGKGGGNEEASLMEELCKLQKWQSLLDLLFDIKAQDTKVHLISEAMMCVVTEMFEVYSRICKGVGRAVMRIYAAPSKTEAQVALGIVQKASMQGEELISYLEFCRAIGILSASDCPKVEQIPQQDIRDLQRIINDEATHSKVDQDEHNDKRALKTIITDKWEVFDEDFITWVTAESASAATALTVSDYTPYNCTNPFLAAEFNPNHHQLMPYPPLHAHNQCLPDLISF